MSLTIGSRIGPYEIVSALGAGGMGEVYRARDTRLDRDVALKILPDAFAADPDRLARFDREAKTLAALSHPNIAAIYGIEGTALVMELVEGDDLSVWIARGPIPLTDALPIAIQIADAVEAAHENGIVHRDLKPANVKVRPDGAVKVLDFGLAKALTGDASGANSPSTSPTLTARATQMGMIIGTAAYMAPEQARGRAVDRRADVWAFGVVLYEMLSGRRAFEGDDISITLASVLKEDVDWSALPSDLPPALRTLLRRCLEKDPKKRLGWIGEARHTLADPTALSSTTSGSASTSGTTLAAPAPPSRGRIALWTGAALVLAALAGLAAWMLKPAPVTTGVLARFAVAIDPDVAFTRNGRRNIAISPDGTKIAFIANNQIYLRRLDETDAQPVRGSDVDPVELAFSPAGDWLAFFQPATPQGPLEKASLRKIPTTGGKPMELCPADAPYGLRWTGDKLLFSTGAAIMSVPEAGGVAAQTIAKADEGAREQLANPQWLNNGRDLLFTVRIAGGDFNDAKIVVQPAAGGARKILVPRGSDARVLPTGHLVYVRDNTLLAQSFDERRLETRGSSVPVIEQLRFAGNAGAGQFDISANGTLAFVPGNDVAKARMVWVDRQGKEEPLGADPMLYYIPRVSPDGLKVAVCYLDSKERDLWIWDIARKDMSRLTKESTEEAYPVWSADSKSVYYRANPTGNFDVFRRATNTGAAEQLTDTPESETPLGLVPGGRLLLRMGATAASPDSTLRTLSTTKGPSEPLAQQFAVLSTGEVSPNGRWLLYQAVESSTQEEVWVRPYPAVDKNRWKVSLAGGQRPMWSRSGNEIIYRAREGTSLRLMSVPVLPAAPGADFAYGTPTLLFDVTRYAFPSIARTFDISHDDKRFLFLSPQIGDAKVSETITVMVNWLDDLKSKVK